MSAKPKLWELVGVSLNEAACTSESLIQGWLQADAFSFFQNAGAGPAEHVQKGAAADCLYGVSVGTAERCLVAQKPHRYVPARLLSTNTRARQHRLLWARRPAPNSS